MARSIDIPQQPARFFCTRPKSAILTMMIVGCSVFSFMSSAAAMPSMRYEDEARGLVFVQMLTGEEADSASPSTTTTTTAPGATTTTTTTVTPTPAAPAATPMMTGEADAPEPASSDVPVVTTATPPAMPPAGAASSPAATPTISDTGLSTPVPTPGAVSTPDSADALGFPMGPASTTAPTPGAQDPVAQAVSSANTSPTMPVATPAGTQPPLPGLGQNTVVPVAGAGSTQPGGASATAGATVSPSDEEAFNPDNIPNYGKPSDSYYDSEKSVPDQSPLFEKPKDIDTGNYLGGKYVIVSKDRSSASPEAALVAAQGALKAGRYEGAMTMFRSLHDRNPDDLRILMGLAVSLQKSGYIADAVKVYEDILAREPENVDAMVNMLGILRAQYPMVALRKLEELYTSHPSNAGVAAQLAIVYADMQRPDDALRYLQVAAQLEPRNPQHVYNMAIIKDQQNKRADAARYYEQALAIGREFPGASLPEDKIRDRLKRIR